MHQKKKHTQHLRAIQVSLDRDSLHLAELKVKLTKEKYDFEKFEGESLTGWFYKILGQREERMEKEHGEYLKAKLLYDQYNSLVQHLTEKKTELVAKLSKLENIENTYQQVLNEKEQFLIINNTSYTKILTRLVEKEAHLSRRIQDKKDALRRATPVIAQLKKIQHELKVAVKWAKRDVRGRKNSERPKYRAIDRAIFQLRKLNQLMTDLNIELKSENLSINGKIKMPYFDRMTDYFSGAFGYDSKVLKLIEGVQAAHVAVLIEVRSVIDNLQKGLHSLKQELNETSIKRTKIIELAE